MKIRLTLLAASFLMITTSSFAREPGDVVSCSFSDGTSWTGTAGSGWTVGDMVGHCLNSGGTATVNRPALTLSDLP